MDTFFGTLLAGLRGRRARQSAVDPSVPSQSTSEQGFLLIEVIISALLVALIVLATFNGFDVVTRLTSDQRNHSEGGLLAAQSQEQLRTDPATALDALESAPHTFTQTYNGTTYTITQEAKPVSASENNTGCVATEATKENGANVEITSSVTWPKLSKAGRPAVKQVSIITPPVGSALEVDVTNGATPEAGVKGITATATFLPSGSGVYTSAEGTTGTAGCIVLTGLATTLATVEIAERTGFVSTGDALKFPTKEVTIAPNITTQYGVTYAEAGRIRGEFTWKGTPVTGDTFVAKNEHISTGYTPYEVGSTAFEYSGGAEEEYKAVTGKYEAKAYTAAGPKKYPKGSLFPFPSSWSVYAGDCPANRVSAESEVAATVKAATETVVKIPTSYTKLNLYTGNDAAHKGSLVSGAYGPVKITNTGCETAAIPDDATARNFTHEQLETETTGGHLKVPYQPFGAYKLCVLAAGIKKTYTVKGTNATATGSEQNIYIGQKTAAEQEALRTLWAKELSERKITSAERTAKETTQKTEETEEAANNVTLEYPKTSC